VLRNRVEWFYGALAGVVLPPPPISQRARAARLRPTFTLSRNHPSRATIRPSCTTSLRGG
jgi:hypothetical protein